MKVRLAGIALATVVAALAATPAQGASLGAAWQLDEGAGTVAQDASGNGNTGAVEGATWSGGRFSSGLSFDGTGDAMRVARSTSLEPQAVTVESWVRASQSPGQFKHIASIGASSCLNASYGVYTGSGGGLAFYVAGGLEEYTISPEAGPEVWDGAWHHVAGTYDGATVRLYVDGVQVGSGSPSSLAIAYGGAETSDFLLGVYGGSCPSALDYAGDLDEVRVWDRALAPVEIAASRDMAAGSAEKLAIDSVRGDKLVYTSRFTDRKKVVISLESASGTQRIESVRVAGGIASCGRFLSSRCRIDLSNGGRTASLEVDRSLLSGSAAYLEVELVSGGDFYVRVDLWG